MATEKKKVLKPSKTVDKLSGLKANVLKIHWDIVTGKETDTSKLKKAKKEVARFLTNEKSKLIKSPNGHSEN
ncbi:hypothetical protein JW962_03920 [Candidatus Dojkabacteria bacterium]|nr:hypothetical protein [Candidatus Dojkabacteria bacterium]